MKKNMLLAIFILISLYVLFNFVYKPFVVSKEVKSSAEKLCLGSYLFYQFNDFAPDGHREFYVQKVTKIDKDYVQLSNIHKFYNPITNDDGFYSPEEEEYKTLKETLSKIIVTGIAENDIPKVDERFIVSETLLKKYPNLKRSRYFYDASPVNPEHFYPVFNDSLTNIRVSFSKKQIIENNRLVPYFVDENGKIKLEDAYGKDIEKIINPNN